MNKLKSIWQIEDLRKKILFTLLLILVFRLGCSIPVPFVSNTALDSMFSNDSIFGYMNMLSGGALSRCAFFALGVSPYINSSIITQLLCVALPSWEALQKETTGKDKLDEYTKRIALAMAAIMSIGYYFVHVTNSVDNGNTSCPVCAGKKIVPGINDLATKCPKAAAMWSNKNERSAMEVTAGSQRDALFVCPDCKKEFKAAISSVVKSVKNGFTGCYDCSMRRINAISKPEWFYTRPMLAFAGENGIPNPFFDARNILGKNSFWGLDFVDHIQKFCSEYNGFAWHNDETIAKDRFKFEAAHKAGYAMIRVLEPGLEVLDQKYDIVIPEGFKHGNAYVPEIMEEVGRKVIHLLEEIYGRKASPEIWALNNFKEFEAWYDANKKELEANAKKRGPKGKTAVKKAA